MNDLFKNTAGSFVDSLGIRYTPLMAVTPQMATEWLKHNPMNRKLKAAHVNELALDMSKGSFKYDASPIRLGVGGVLLDGQHRLNAVVKSDTTQLFLVIENLPVETFETIDMNSKPRNLGDQFCIDNIENYSLIAGALNRLPLLRHGRTASKGKYSHGSVGEESKVLMTNKEKAEFYKENSSVIQNLARKTFLYYKQYRLLAPSTILAYMIFLIIDKNTPQDKVLGFFERLLTDVPRDFMCIHEVYKTLVLDKDKHSIGAKKRQGMIIKAWNYWLRDKNVKNLNYSPTKDADITWL